LPSVLKQHRRNRRYYQIGEEEMKRRPAVCRVDSRRPNQVQSLHCLATKRAPGAHNTGRTMPASRRQKWRRRAPLPSRFQPFKRQTGEESRRVERNRMPRRYTSGTHKGKTAIRQQTANIMVQNHVQHTGNENACSQSRRRRARRHERSPENARPRHEGSAEGAIVGAHEGR